jgi:hypothetical protein
MDWQGLLSSLLTRVDWAVLAQIYAAHPGKAPAATILLFLFLWECVRWVRHPHPQTVFRNHKDPQKLVLVADTDVWEPGYFEVHTKYIDTDHLDSRVRCVIVYEQSKRKRRYEFVGKLQKRNASPSFPDGGIKLDPANFSRASRKLRLRAGRGEESEGTWPVTVSAKMNRPLPVISYWNDPDASVRIGFKVSVYLTLIGLLLG